MSLPVYFVQPPGLPAPPGKLSLCGWHAAPDGSLNCPPASEPAGALVFDDRRSIPEHFDALIASILRSRDAQQAEIIILDFERRPTPASLSFVKELSDRCPTAAPQPYCDGTTAQPIFCYCPRLETFADFSRRIRVTNAWLELRPIDETVHYPISGMAPSESSASFFSDILQCCYETERTPKELTLHLYDTPESLLRRALTLSPHLKAAIGLRSELETFQITDAITSRDKSALHF